MDTENDKDTKHTSKSTMTQKEKTQDVAIFFTWLHIQIIEHHFFFNAIQKTLLRVHLSWTVFIHSTVAFVYLYGANGD